MTARLEGPVTSEARRRFEHVDAAFPELRPEIIDGAIYISTAITSAHGQMVLTLASQLVSRWCVMTEVDTVHAGWGDGTLVRPDISVADASFRGNRLREFPADELGLVIEVVSQSNPENDTRRKVKKYALAGIPYYLVVNPIEGRCLLYASPSGGSYRDTVERPFGDAVTLGHPLDVELDTTALYTY